MLEKPLSNDTESALANAIYTLGLIAGSKELVGEIRNAQLDQIAALRGLFGEILDEHELMLKAGIERRYTTIPHRAQPPQ